MLATIPMRRITPAVLAAVLFAPACDSLEELERDNPRDYRSDRFRPATAQNVRATIVSDRHIEITWEGEFSELSEMAVYRRVGDGEFEAVATASAKDGLFVDEFEMEPEDRLRYLIDTVPSSGSHAPESNDVVYQIFTPGALSVRHVDSDRLRLEWEAETGPHTGFVIERRLDAIGTWDEVTRVDASTLSYEDGPLDTLQTYLYRLAAYNARHQSEPATTRAVGYQYGADELATISRPQFAPYRRTQARFAANSTLIVIGGWDHRLRVVNFATDETVREVSVHAAPLVSLAALRDRDQIVSLDAGGSVVVWEAGTGSVSDAFDVEADGDSPIALHPSGSLVAVGKSLDDPDDWEQPLIDSLLFNLYSIPGGVQTAGLRQHRDARLHTFHPRDEAVVYSVFDLLYRQELHGTSEARSIRSYCEIMALDVTPGDGRYAVLGGAGSCSAAPTSTDRAKLKIYDLHSLERVDSYATINESNTALALHPLEDLALTGPGTYPGRVTIVRIPTGEVVARYGVGISFSSMEVSPDGRYLALISGDRVVIHRFGRLWLEQ